MVMVFPSPAFAVNSPPTTSPRAARASASRNRSWVSEQWVHQGVSQNGLPITSSRVNPANSSGAELVSMKMPSVVKIPRYPNMPSMTWWRMSTLGKLHTSGPEGARRNTRASRHPTILSPSKISTGRRPGFPVRCTLFNRSINPQRRALGRRSVNVLPATCSGVMANRSAKR